MPEARHTSLSLKAQIKSAAESLSDCDPSDFFCTTRLLQNLTQLRAQLEQDQMPELAALCALPMKLAEALNKEGKIGPKPALEAIDGLMASVFSSLGIEPPAPLSQEAPTPAAPTPAKAPQAAGPTKPGSGTSAQPGLKLVSNRKLGEMLIQMSLLTPSQVEQALSHQRMTGCRFGEALIQMRILSRETVESALRMQGARRSTPRDNPWGSR